MGHLKNEKVSGPIFLRLNTLRIKRFLLHLILLYFLLCSSGNTNPMLATLFTTNQFFKQPHFTVVLVLEINNDNKYDLYN